MADYQNEPISEVQRFAKQGDKDALYEMAWRMPADIQNDPVESCAWQDIWFEKAADAGNVDAQSRYARSLVNRIMDAECRQKAMKYFEILVADFDAGKLSGEHLEDGAIAKLWLGIMLCEGYHTQRDAAKGSELIQTAGALLNGFEGFGFGVMRKLSEIYSSGMAQVNFDPTADDMMQARKYLSTAIERFDPKRDDPNNRGFLQMAKDLLPTLTLKIRTEKDIENDATYWHKKNMTISDAARQRLVAEKSALARLKQYLAQNGW